MMRRITELNRGKKSKHNDWRDFPVNDEDGKDEKKDIRNFVDNYLLARDSRAFREHIKTTQPDVKMEYVLENGEEVVVPIGLNFFWPDY